MEHVVTYTSSMKALSMLMDGYQLGSSGIRTSRTKGAALTQNTVPHGATAAGESVINHLLYRREAVLPSRATSKTLQSIGSSLAQQLISAGTDEEDEEEGVDALAARRGDAVQAMLNSHRVQLVSISTSVVRGQAMAAAASQALRHRATGTAARAVAVAGGLQQQQGGVEEDSSVQSRAAKKRKTGAPSHLPSSTARAPPAVVPLPLPLPLPMTSGAAQGYASYVRGLAARALALLQPQGGTAQRNSSSSLPSILSPVLLMQGVGKGKGRGRGVEGGSLHALGPMLDTGKLSRASALLDCMSRVVADACATLAPSARVSNGALPLLLPLKDGEVAGTGTGAGAGSGAGERGRSEAAHSYVKGVLAGRPVVLQALDLVAFLSACLAPTLTHPPGTGGCVPLPLLLRVTAQVVARQASLQRTEEAEADSMQEEKTAGQAALDALEQLVDSAQQLRSVLAAATAAHASLLAM